MARQRTDLVYRPQPTHQRPYAKLYHVYRALTPIDGAMAAAMRELRAVGHVEV
jgi:hypothetical protein